MNRRNIRVRLCGLVLGIACFAATQSSFAGTYTADLIKLRRLGNSGASEVQSYAAQHLDGWTAAGNKGDADAQACVGTCCRRGFGVKQDYGVALQWLRLSASANNATAMHDIGEMYAAGQGVEKSETEATRWYRQAVERLRANAEAGDAHAMLDLGIAYMAGNGVTRDPAEAIKWLRKSGEAGDPAGMSFMGVMYSIGMGVPKNDEEAAKWYRKSADAGDPVGMCSLGEMYANGRGVTQDNAEAMRWYGKAAEAGSGTAMTKLGSMYSQGHGATQDYAEAVKWFRKAAEAGDADGMTNLGMLYNNGQGVLLDYAEAMKWYRKAAERGNTDGMTGLGQLYEFGQAVPKDEAIAAEWYRKAAVLGNTFAMTNLGILYGDGRGVQRDDAVALALFKKAAAAGDDRARFHLECHQNEGRDPESNAAFRARPEFARMRTSTQRAWREVLAVHSRFAGHADSATVFRQVSDAYVAIDLVDVDSLLQKSIEQTVQALTAANEFASTIDRLNGGRAEDMRAAGQVGAAAGQMVGDGKNPNADALTGGLIAMVVTGLVQDADKDRLRPQIEKESASVTRGLDMASRQERDAADGLTRKYDVTFIKAK